MLGVFDPRRMSIPQEIERLAKLHADGALSDEDVAIARSLLRDVRVARIDQSGHSVYPWKIAAVLRDFFQG